MQQNNPFEVASVQALQTEYDRLFGVPKLLLDTETTEGMMAVLQIIQNAPDWKIIATHGGKAIFIESRYLH